MPGWIIGFLNWLLTNSLDSFTRILLIVVITDVIGFGSFYHNIVRNIEVFGAVLYSDSVSVFDYVWFLILALLGNSIGGGIVVGLFKYRIFQSNYYLEINKASDNNFFKILLILPEITV